MSESMIRYAQYDVLFLKYFYYRIVQLGSQFGQTDAERLDIMGVYRYFMPQLSGLVTLETNRFITLRETCKADSDPANNYMFFLGSKQYKLIDVYKRLFPGIVTTSPKVELDKIMRVSQFKLITQIILKRLIYGHISQTYQVFQKKGVKWEEKLYNDHIIQFFQKSGMDYLHTVFAEVDGILEKRVARLGR